VALLTQDIEAYREKRSKTPTRCSHSSIVRGFDCVPGLVPAVAPGGDENDLRFLDPSPRIVALKAKGAGARRDITGFVLPEKY